MDSLLVFRERIVNFYAKNEIYIKPILKFFLTLVIFFAVSDSFGYNSILGNPGVYLILALICMFVPKTGAVYIVAVHTLICLVSVSAEYAIVAVFLFLLVMLLYMQFSPEYAYIILISVVCCMFNAAPAIAVIAGFLIGFSAIVPVISGVIIHSVLSFVPDYLELINLSENPSEVGGIVGLRYIINNVLVNRELILSLIGLVLLMLLICILKRLRANHSWTLALFVGVITYFIFILIFSNITSADMDMIGVIVSVLITMAAGGIVILFFRNLEYKATERVQFEDDEFYYYVKAIPKRSVNYVNKNIKNN